MMKQINIYFGKQQESVFGGNFADIVKFLLNEEEINNFIEVLKDGTFTWATIKTESGIKMIRKENILWIDIIDIKEENKNDK